MVSKPDFSIKFENHVVKEHKRGLSFNKEILRVGSINKKKVLKTYIVNGSYELDHDQLFTMHIL